MKQTLLFVMLFVWALPAFSQKKSGESYLGVKGALSHSQNTFHNPSLSGFDEDFEDGFAGGLYFHLGMTPKFGIQIELLYSEMGSQLIPDSIPNPNTTTLKLNYLSIPLMLKYNPNWRLGIFAGPQFDFLSSAHSDFNHNGGKDINEQVTKNDLSGTIGVEYWITRWLGVYGRFVTGFTNINEKSPGIELETGTVTSDVYNHAWQIGVTLALRGKKEAAPTVAPVPVMVDSDSDGIADAQDKCPTQAGTAKYSGCPIPDTDGDGVNDELDKCPNQTGTAKYEGCPVPDSDGDGVNDDIDRCPKTPGAADNRGCPELIVYFQREEIGLTNDDKTHLEKAINFLKNNPDINVIIEGHTSAPGGAEYNKTLSEKRATEVIDYFISQGISSYRMTPKGLGEQFPIGDQKTDEGRAKSRRVVIKIAN